MSLRPTCAWSSAGSTRAGGRTRPARTSRTRGTTSGRLLHDAGFTPRLYAPEEQHDLPALGLGLTNAAYRTTPGSGDLRRADFEGAAERLEALARELHPGSIAFVGKEAYRGAFNERPELGAQSRTLGDTQLFVLPSTSPANAAVPYAERLCWFEELAARA
jgi:double-stranded uracil-DNA glycosylase